jgi:RND family efflux transporter MFP subunit
LGAGAKPTEGSAISPQAPPFTVVDFSALRFTAEVDEADIDRVKVDMMAMVSLDAFPGEEFSATVSRINPAAQPTATGGTVFAVELELAGVAKDILLGMKGDADVEVSSRGSALTVPVEALFSEGGTDFVYSIVAGKLKKTEITVGATTDTDIEVLSGLQAGDAVALSGSTQYVDGMAVREKK